MIRRRRLRLTPGTDRTLPDPHDPSLPQVSPTQPAPNAPIPPPEPTPEPPPPTPPTAPEPPAAPPTPPKPDTSDPGPTDRDAAPARSLAPSPRRAAATIDTIHDAASPTTPPRPGKVLPSPRPTSGPVPSTAPLQLELQGEHTRHDLLEADLPLPKDDRTSVRVRGVWMRTDDDDRLSRRGTRDDLWSLQRSQRRPQPQPTL